MTVTDYPSVSGIILAGGEGRRMGGRDKGWLDLNGNPLIHQVILRIKDQVDEIIISANRNIDAYQSLAYPVVQDPTPYQGPLGGIATGLEAMKAEYALVVPTDAPLIPQGLVSTLAKYLPAKLVLCHDGQRLQPLFGLYHCTLKDSIKTFLAKGDRKLGLWCEQHSPKIVTIGDTRGFTNLNTPQDFKDFEKTHP